MGRYDLRLSGCMPLGGVPLFGGFHLSAGPGKAG